MVNFDSTLGVREGCKKEKVWNKKQLITVPI